jgi:hypothetical protein
MMKREIRGIFLKALWVLAPFAAIFGWYIYEDPFKVIYSYDSYIASGEHSYVFVNRDYLGMENYMKRKATVPYDAFIFGNSRATYFEVEDWLPHIAPAQPYHMDASGEGLFGVWKKMQYLDTAAHAIQHAILLLDRGMLKVVFDPPSHITMKHPILSGRSRFGFQFEFFKVFLHHSFFWAYIDLKWSGTFKPYMAKDGIFDDYILHYEPLTNEQKLMAFEEQIARDTQSYYASRMHYFYERDTAALALDPPVIAETQKNMLLDIAHIFRKHKTHFQIIISPLYDAVPMHAADMKWLEETFGKERVHDFSGWNSYTRNYLNYYENSHFRPHVAKSMMDHVYKSQPKDSMMTHQNLPISAP